MNISGIAAISSFISTSKTMQDVSISMMKKSQDMAKQQGNDLAKLIESTNVLESSVDISL